MSYASGLALGLCAGKKFHEFFRASQAVSSAAKKLCRQLIRPAAVLLQAHTA